MKNELFLITLKYRKQVDTAYNFIKYVRYFLIALLVLAVASGILTKKIPSSELYIVYGILLGLIIIYSINLYFLSAFSGATVDVFSDYFILKQPKRKKEFRVNFSEINRVQPFLLGDSAGYFVIHLKNKKKYRMTVVLQNSECLLEAIYNFNPRYIEKADYEKLLIRLINIDQSYLRYYETVANWSLFNVVNIKNKMLMYVLLPTLFIGYNLYQHGNDFIVKDKISIAVNYGVIYLCAIFLFVALLFAIYDQVSKKHFFKTKALKNIRDVEFERKMSQRTFAVMLPLFILGVFLYGELERKDAVLLTASLPKDYDFLSLRKNDLIRYDIRYNCIDCKYGLKVGNAVVFNEGIGKIVGFSGDKVALSHDEKGRALASEMYVKVPIGKMLIQRDLLLTKNKLSVVDLDDIKGKIIKGSSF